MKKLLSLAIATVMALSCSAVAFAAESPEMSGVPGNGAITQHIQYVDFDELKAACAALAEEQEDVALTELTNSAIGGEGEYHFENIIVVRANVSARTNITNVLVPARTAIYFEREVVNHAKMTVTYVPTDIPLYYGLATNNDGTGSYMTHEARNGYGSGSFKPAVDYYYPYLGNSSGEPALADFSYTTLG